MSQQTIPIQLSSRGEKQNIICERNRDRKQAAKYGIDKAEEILNADDDYEYFIGRLGNTEKIQHPPSNTDCGWYRMSLQ